MDEVRGTPEIRFRPEPFDLQLMATPLPTDAGKIIECSPVVDGGLAIWLLLAQDGRLSRFDADSGECRLLMRVSLMLEPDHEPWCGHTLRHRLYASPGGEFAAIVNDYGRHGQIVDLRSGHITCVLDGGAEYSETVPFSFMFAKVNGRVVAIHRTSWNRLDVSDPATGNLLTDRSPTSWQQGSERPEHDLDYFHGALYVSPNSVRIADDGWVWHPVGIPTTWSLEEWILNNVWESEDGPTMRSLCHRAYYWDHAMTWLDDNRIAIGGLGDDDNEMIDGARVFDLSLPGGEGQSYADSRLAHEVTAFAGPAGTFFSDGESLFSSDEDGLSRWDVNDGSRTGFRHGFKPVHHHQGSHELVEIVDNTLVRWRIV